MWLLVLGASSLLALPAGWLSSGRSYEPVHAPVWGPRSSRSYSWILGCLERKGDDPFASCLSWLLGHLQLTREELRVVLYGGRRGFSHILSACCCSCTSSGMWGLLTPFVLRCAKITVSPETPSDLRLVLRVMLLS